jgi:TrkA domain protein
VDLHIREQPLPGIGHRYELALREQQRRLVLVVQNSGRCEIGVLNEDADQPEVTVTLDRDQAVAGAALLTGARFPLDTTEDDRTPADEVEVETITLAPASPAAGRLLSDIPLLPDSDAAVLAVIRDATPELIEDEEHTPVRPGDRLVVAARRDRIAAVTGHLAG